MNNATARIQIGGAGGAPSNNVIRSLRESSHRYYLIGTSSQPSDLFLADVDEKYVVLAANHPDYPQNILKIIGRTKPDLLHVQHDFEVRAISRQREKIQSLGVKLFIPAPKTIENCVNKYKSYQIWKATGIRVPKTILLRNAGDLKQAFKKLGETIWIRDSGGGGGQGALPTDNFEFAKLWIDHFQGWGRFSASKLLTKNSVTWLSIWHEGELVVAQSRRRWSWNFGDRTLSGITGVTGVAETISDTVVDRVALDAIHAIDEKPHGIFGVDMTYGHDGWPNPTEINIGRFFTTVYFFTKAGLNLPEIYCSIALKGKFPSLMRKINPLPDGLLWIRGMDVEPVLTNVTELAGVEKSGES